MLEFFRRHIGGGLVGFILVGLLAAAFALTFGEQSKGWGEGQIEQIVAAAAGYDISETTMDYAYNMLGGRNLNGNDSDGLSLRMTALDGLVERGLLLNMAEEVGITASADEAVDRIIKGNMSLSRPVSALMERMEAYPFFDPKDAAQVLLIDGHRIPQSFKNAEGEFNMDFYKNFVRNHLRQTEESFIEQQRQEIIAERMRKLIVSAVRISDDEARLEYNRENDTASVKYIRVMPAHFADKLKPSSEELSQWTDAHREEIKSYYETNQAKYTDLEEQVRARHILVRLEENATEEEQSAAKAKIEGLYSRIQAGEDFSTLASESSDDTVSAEKGGDLGYNTRGRMVPEFDDAMFALKPGEVSQIVKTKYGFHIIKVDGIRKGNVSLEEATPEIAEQLYKEANSKVEAEKTANELLNRIKNGESMEAVLPKDDSENKGPFSLKISTSRPFTKTAKTIAGIGPAESIIKSVFEGSIQTEKHEINGDYFIITVNERNQPSDEDFEGKKVQIKEKLLSMKQSVLLVKQIKSLRDKAEREGKIKILYAPKADAETKTDIPKNVTDVSKTQPKKQNKTESAAKSSSNKENRSADDNDEVAADPEGE